MKPPIEYRQPRPLAGDRKVVAEIHYLGEPEGPQPTGHALIDLSIDPVETYKAAERAKVAERVRRYRAKKAGK